MRKVLKWVGIVLGVLVGLIVIAAVVIYAKASALVAAGHPLPGHAFTIPTSAEAVARGDYLVNHVSGCRDCHAEDLGGQDFLQDPSIGTLWTPNLTKGQGGIGATYTADDWERSIRHGVRPNGQYLLIMPAQHLTHLSDEDLGAILAYVQTFPPVDRAIPARSFTPMAHILLGAGLFGKLPAETIDHNAAHVASMAPAVSAEYGHYMTELASCGDCHGNKLDGVSSGGPPADVKPPDLTPSGDLATWTEADFLKALQTGVTPSGRTLSEEMPWKIYGTMAEQDLAAIFAYLKSLPPSGAN